MAEDEDKHQILNIVLLGHTGNGKSTTGNTIIGKKVFQSIISPTSRTMECKTHRVVTPDGTILNVIDTPGMFDLAVSTEFARCLTLADGRIDAALLVLSARNRMSEEEPKTFISLQALFGSKILDYLIVVFTGGDLFEEHGYTLDDYLRDRCPNFLEQFLILSGRRVILFDNETRNETKRVEQVHKLISLVKQVGRLNKGKPYTNDKYCVIKKETNTHKEKQNELETKGFLEEQVGAMKKELQLSYDQNLKAMSEMVEKTLKEAMVAQERVTNDMYRIIKEETDRQRDNEKELESKGVSEEQVAAMKRELQLSYEQNLKGMSEMVEKTLKEAMVAQERVTNELRRENDDLRNRTQQPQAPQQCCNIL